MSLIFFFSGIDSTDGKHYTPALESGGPPYRALRGQGRSRLRPAMGRSVWLMRPNSHLTPVARSKTQSGRATFFECVLLSTFHLPAVAHMRSMYLFVTV